MKESLTSGVETTRRITVDEKRTIDFMGEALRVYATPEIVADMEYTCRDLLLEHLDDGEDSVGVRVEIDHSGATLLGMSVNVAVTVTGVEGRMVDFDYTVTDHADTIATGRHRRFVVDVERLKSKLQAKADETGP